VHKSIQSVCIQSHSDHEHGLYVQIFNFMHGN
jgi:hypothetical protein